MQYLAIPCNTMQYHATQCNTMQYHVNCVTKSTIHKIALNLNLNLNRCLCSHCSCCSHCSRCRHCRQTKGGFPLQPLRGRNKVSKIMLVMVQIPYVNCPYIFGTLAEGWPPPLLEELDEHFLGVLLCFQVCSIADQVSVHYLPNICKFDWKPPQQKWQKLTKSLCNKKEGWLTSIPWDFVASNFIGFVGKMNLWMKKFFFSTAGALLVNTV